jgi:hypothetical protein
VRTNEKNLRINAEFSRQFFCDVRRLLRRDGGGAWVIARQKTDEEMTPISDQKPQVFWRRE